MLDKHELVQCLHRIVELNSKQCTQYPPLNVIGQHFVHAAEELGEMAKCFRDRNDATLEEESIDLAICALAVALLENGGDMTSLHDIMSRKLDKWENNLKSEEEE